MTRAKLTVRVLALLLYVIWREWICGRSSSVHPTEVGLLLVKLLAGADLAAVNRGDA